MTDDPQEEAVAGHTTGVPRSIANRLMELRLSRGMTASELARRSGVDRSNISRIESGRHEPSAATLEKLANALGIQAGDLLTSDATAVPSRGILALNRDLSPDADRDLRELLRDLYVPLTMTQGAIGLLMIDPDFPDIERLRIHLHIADRRLREVTDAIARYVATQEALLEKHTDRKLA